MSNKRGIVLRSYFSSTNRPMKERKKNQQTPGGTVCPKHGLNDRNGRRQAEENLAESESRLHALSDNLADGMVYQIDSGVDGRERKITFISAAVQRLHGLSVEEARRNPAVLYNQVIEEDRPLVARQEAEAFAKAKPLDLEVRVRLPSGKVRWRRFISAPRRAKDGRYLWDGIEMDVTARKQAELEAAQSRQQLRALLARLQSLQEAEQARLAREVHDVLGQGLTALKMDLVWALGKLSQMADAVLREQLRERLAAAGKTVDGMVEEARAIARSLRPRMLDDLGLEATLQAEAKAFQERSGMTCQVSVPERPLPLSPLQTTEIYRIFQELLTNIARHSGASRVRVILDSKGGNVRLIVRDNGRGITREQLANTNSLGLLSIRERAALVGGRVEIRGRANRGTTAILVLPLDSTGADTRHNSARR
mgnify:CR=1 FL=1